MHCIGRPAIFLGYVAPRFELLAEVAGFVSKDHAESADLTGHSFSLLDPGESEQVR